jgi:ribokinase
VVAGTPTGVALIVVDAPGENSIVVVAGANDRLDPHDFDAVLVAPGDVVVAQLEVPAATVAAAFARARARGATTLLNATPVHDAIRELASLVDVLVVNEHELNALASSAITSESNATEIRAAVTRLDRWKAATTVVTLGARGAVALVGDRLIEIPGVRARVVDTTGAGDCFIGTLAACLATGASLESGLAFANAAASICVERRGAGPSMPTLQEIRERAS